jgi:hypothetical protein
MKDVVTKRASPRELQGCDHTSRIRCTCLVTLKAAETVDKVSRTDSLLGILRSFENYCATAFGSTIRPDVDVGTNDVACGPEQILQILPPSLIGQLQKY